LAPEGWLVRRPYRRRHTQENRDASAATRRGGVPGGAPRKKVVKRGVGAGWPRARSLLMGAFPTLVGFTLRLVPGPWAALLPAVPSYRRLRGWRTVQGRPQ